MLFCSGPKTLSNHICHMFIHILQLSAETPMMNCINIHLILVFAFACLQQNPQLNFYIHSLNFSRAPTKLTSKVLFQPGSHFPHTPPPPPPPQHHPIPNTPPYLPPILCYSSLNIHITDSQREHRDREHIV